MSFFDDENVNLDVLKRKAYNLRWAEVEEGVIPLTAADPDFPCPPMVKQAMLDYISMFCSFSQIYDTVNTFLGEFNVLSISSYFSLTVCFSIVL
jgi:hypothetical protein